MGELYWEGTSADVEEERIIIIETNLDDMTGEAIGFAIERIWDSGALDVYTTPIQMKKNRPGVLLSCICREEDKESCIDAFFRYTSSLGVRYQRMERRILSRSMDTRQTDSGPVRIKNSYYKDMEKRKAEYEDLRRIALEENISLTDAEQYL